MTETTTVRTAAELTAAARDRALLIEVEGTISGMPSLLLPPGATLRGGHLIFGGRGVRVTTGTTLTGITIETEETEVAVYADTSVEDLGTLTLDDVSTVGQIAIIAEGRLRRGHVSATNVTVVRADLRGRYHRPHAYGVDALQGAFTLWNRQPTADARFTAELEHISVGTAQHPVRGSGVFVGGSTDDGGHGTVHVTHLSTGTVVTDGGIAAGTPDGISGGVFVIGGATVDVVENLGSVTTYGQNDMVLDNWGEVENWHARDAVTSHGPSGIGFVNFGSLGTLRVEGPIRTTGVGSRGFNLYDGSLREASFSSITTSGDGAIGVQLSRPLPRLSVSGDIATGGGTGTSLVKGEQVTLEATALSIKPGGSIDSLDVSGTISTAGSGITTVELDGPVGEAHIGGGIRATGPGSTAVRADALPPALDGVEITPPFNGSPTESDS